MTEPYYVDDTVTLYAGDCTEVMAGMADNSVDAVVTDPPYGLEFMGKEWDKFRVDDPGTSRHRGERAGKHGALAGDPDESLPSRLSGVLFDKTKREARGVSYGGGKRPTTNRCAGCGKRDQFRNPHASCPEGTAWASEIINPHSAPPTLLAFQAWCQLWAAECLRILKPGGHMLVFGGTRTHHRLACAIEDAGFEIRDSIGYGYGVLAWCYGSGFPKSRNVSKDERFCQCLPDLRDAATEEAAESAAQVLLSDLRGEGEANPADLAGLHGLPVTLYPDHAIPGRTQQDVLGRVRQEAAQHGYAGPSVAQRSAGDDSMHPLRSAGAPVTQSEAADIGDVLLQEVPIAGAPTDAVGQCVRRDGEAGSATVRSGQPSVEGRGDVQASEGQLHRAEVRSLPTGTAADGPVGRVRDGAPTGYGAVDGAHPTAERVREPHQPQPTGQSPGESGAVPVERGSQAGRGWPLCAGCGKPAIPRGLGTALKPAWEPIVTARKPLSGNVAANVQQWGTGALNIDATRVVTNGDDALCRPAVARHDNAVLGKGLGSGVQVEPVGRWPPNVVLDGYAAAELDRQTGVLHSQRPTAPSTMRSSHFGGGAVTERQNHYDDIGAAVGASRFFPVFRYEAKAPAFERPRVAGVGNGVQNYGGYGVRCCDTCARRSPATGPLECGHDAFTWTEPLDRRPGQVAHPTVKPLDLMRWLVRLVTPPGGLVLDPFAGSGTTGEACIVEGFRCVLIENDPDYLPLIVGRLSKPIQPDMFGGVG